ncbi:MAG TPA: YihY/virulence factor BrkB family protein [Thermodesulfovibrionales bacterium]|nr:YihY/virulence factor BrkB family protein [Thermodesulfovibrionales bacterium]
MSQRFSNYMSILLIGPVLIFSAIGITATLMSSTVMKKLMAFHLFGIIFYIISRLMPYLLISAAFTVVYILLPNTRVRFRAALTGGIAAAVLWQTIGWFFTSFVAKSAQYSAIYSGFATLILFLIWLYWNFLTLLIGARVAFYTQNPHLLDVGGRVQRPGEQMKEKLALSIMFLIGRSFHTDGRHWTFASLTQRLGRHADPVREVLSILEDKGLLVPTHAEPPAYLPGKDIAAMTLNEIVSAVRTPGEDNHIPGRAASVAEVVDIMKDIETAVASSLNNRTLRDLVISTDTAGS